MKADNFHLPDDIKRQLVEIFTDQYIDAVESECRRYLHETAKIKPGVATDGRTLSEIAEKAGELRQLLIKSSTALKRVHRHVSDEFNKRDTLLEVIELGRKLEILEDICLVNPATERAGNPRLGRPKGTVNKAERALAFALWEFYRQAHGKPAKRSSDLYKHETGPLSRAAAIPGPVLKLPSDLSRYFREIGDMDKKSKST